MRGVAVGSELADGTPAPATVPRAACAECSRESARRLGARPSAPHETLFAQRLGRWASANGSVEVVGRSGGTWRRSEGCAAPRLWLFLYGHYRTFYWTQRHLEAMARSSRFRAARLLLG